MCTADKNGILTTCQDVLNEVYNGNMVLQPTKAADGTTGNQMEFPTSGSVISFCPFTGQSYDLVELD